MDGLSLYLGVKLVSAKAMTRGEYNIFRGELIPPTNKNPNDDGYFIVYPDGYQTWCSKKQFEEANRVLDAMPFGHAIEAAKKGHKVARRGWNGKNMFVFIRAGRWISGVDTTSPMGGDFESLPHFCMRAADGKCVVGWLASQTDMLSDDWMIVQ